MFLATPVFTYIKIIAAISYSRETVRKLSKMIFVIEDGLMPYIRCQLLEQVNIDSDTCIVCQT